MVLQHRAVGIAWGVKEQHKPGRQLSGSQKKHPRRHDSFVQRSSTCSASINASLAIAKCVIAALPKRSAGLPASGAGRPLTRKEAVEVRLIHGEKKANDFERPNGVHHKPPSNSPETQLAECCGLFRISLIRRRKKRARRSSINQSFEPATDCPYQFC